MFTDYLFKWLENALDFGVSESDFWNMTLAELERLLDSKRRTQKRQAQEQATFDYVLADLIGRSIARLYSSGNEIPDIATVYPTLFDSKQIEEQKSIKKAELSAARFRQFANSFNAKRGARTE